MNKIFNAGKALVAEINSDFKPELLKEIFDLRTEKWKYYQKCDDCGTFGIFADLRDFQYNSYNLIPAAIEIVLAQEDADLFTTALSLLSTCIEESDTTEMPIELSKQWEVIERRVNKHQNKDSFLLWNIICKWYRVCGGFNRDWVI